MASPTNTTLSGPEAQKSTFASDKSSLVARASQWKIAPHPQNQSVPSSATQPQSQPPTSSNPAPVHDLPVQTEEDDMARAIANSYEDQGRVASQEQTPGDSAKPAAKSTTPRETLELLMENLALRVSNDFAPLDDIHGDTLIYIGPPSKLPHHSVEDYAHIKKHFHRIFQVDSSSLKALGSKKLGIGEKQLLGPGCCIRAKKKLKKLDIYNQIDQHVRDSIKYHIDLRPPSEDDDAVLLLTDLTCTRGVRTWYRAKEKYQLPGNLVLGTDELDTDSNPYQASVSGDPPNVETIPAADGSSAPKVGLVTDLLVSELCPLRQHSAVERMLQAIYGNDPKLDSAPKAWAFFATANFYDCAQHPSISKWIDKWLYTGKNASFIQSNPEVAYRIGMGCQLAHLVQDAYSILVGEKALLDVTSELSGSVPDSSRSIHGREHENLDDDEQNRVSHAASSLIRRMRDLYQSLVIDMDWLKDCTEYQKLAAFQTESDNEKDDVGLAAGIIRQFCASRLSNMMSKHLRMPFNDLDVAAANTRAFRNGNVPHFVAVYNNLGAEARPFTRSFWIILQRIQLTDGHWSNSATESLPELTSNLLSLIAPSAPVERRQIVSALSHVNDILWDRSRRQAGHMKPISVSPKAVQQPRSTESRSDSVRKSSGFRQIIPNVPAQAKANNDGSNFFEPLASPKRPSEPMAGPSSDSPGKRRKTLEQQDEEDTFPMSSVQGTETDQLPVGALYRSNISGVVYRGRTLARDEDAFKDIPLRVRNPDQPLFPLNQKGPFAGHIAGDDRMSKQDELQQPRIFPAPPAPPKASLLDTTKVPSNEQTSSYVEQDDDEGMPVYRMSQPATLQPPKASDVASDFDRWWGAPDLGYQPSDRAASDNATTYARQVDMLSPFSASTSSASKPKPKILQQFSNSSPPDDWDMDMPGRYPVAADYECPRPQLFEVNSILSEMSRVLSRKCDEIVYPPHLFHGVQQTPIDLVDTLVCLDEDEWKFLPLWAGGYDDGEGGVFNEVDVPNDDAAGFKGGKRGIRGGVAGSSGEGSVSGSEDSFDDIADEAVSTVGKASKFATDGTATVRSVSEPGDERSDDGFMNQDDVYAVVQAMSMERMEKGKGKGKEKAGDGWVPGDEFDFDNDDMLMDDDDDGGDVSTVMGAGSDVQGQFFGGSDNDGDHEQDETAEESDDSDMVVVNGDEL